MNQTAVIEKEIVREKPVYITINGVAYKVPDNTSVSEYAKKLRDELLD